MADLITGVTADTIRSVNSQSLLTDVGAFASQVAGSLPPVETTYFDTETFRREKWNLGGASTSVDDACPRPRLCTEHFDLTLDDSQEEGLADDMHGCELARPCRTATPHRVMVGCSALRWTVRRRGTCEVRDTTPKYKENWIPTRTEMQILGGRVGLFVEWADCIETGGGTLEERRLEYRELLGEMAIYEEDLNGTVLKQYTDLTTIAWWEHDETEGRGARIAHPPRWSTPAHSTSAPYAKYCPSQARQTEQEDLRGGSGDERLGQPPPTLHQVRSDLVHWEVVMGAGRWVGRMGTHFPSRVDGAL